MEDDDPVSMYQRQNSAIQPNLRPSRILASFSTVLYLGVENCDKAQRNFESASDINSKIFVSVRCQSNIKHEVHTKCVLIMGSPST